MKLTLVSLFILLSCSTVYGQNISAGVRVGGSIWNNADAGFNTVNPEIGVFVRSEPIKRVSFDLGFNAYKLKRDFSNYDISHEMNCKELTLAVQYNYLRLLKKSLMLYAGLDYSHVFASLKTSGANNPRQPALSPYVNNSSHQFYMVGLNQSVIYQFGKTLAVATTFSYKTNLSELNGRFPRALAGYTRLNLQTGIAYQIN